ncbi:helix-turn-helix domain-containing protein [Flavihumibacter petaseus]|uniref:Putative AraC family transcriptional regulator n=1 Tax=Flavihumibacter petaseus NBRC 106054 TaxID=1220578 RepID=A0A0E9N3H5_9BACT|nr:helix-turn-helix transcriptional regulator [Flavihumibacter petaseus]GAO44527.1 putative AraC family transcriptional regulator [Flavihumibacter petaseus NBRC 106054]
MKLIPVRQIAKTPTLPGTTGRFRIRDLQHVLNGKDLAQDHHKHDFIFVLAVQQGNGHHEIDFKSYEVHNNVVFILRPGQVHQLRLTAGSTGFLMEFDLSFYQPPKKALYKNHCTMEPVQFEKLHTHLVTIAEEFTHREESYQEAIKARLDLFFIDYIRQSPNPSAIADTGNNYQQEQFEALAALLEANISNLKTVSEYADLLNLSSYQLNAITKASVGKTVSEMINDQIILEAKRQLLATPNQVKDIAGHLGYEDASYFVRFFKKQTGQSPEAFRKNSK